MTPADPLGRAMHDHYTPGRAGELTYRDGSETERHDVAGTYFTDPTDWSPAWRRRLDSLDGPVLDVGCGTGKYAQWLAGSGRQVVGIDTSPKAIETARGRGLQAAFVMDMFALGFDRNRFRSALVVGTQSGLAGTLPGVRAFLTDLARVTTSDATAIVDSYDPAGLDPESFIGYRPDPRAGLARRAFHFEYDRPDGGREVGPTLSFVLFGPDRLRDVLVGTAWDLLAVWPQTGYYRAKLEK
jgi:SAM-dependent methyltransferase